MILTSPSAPVSAAKRADRRPNCFDASRPATGSWSIGQQRAVARGCVDPGVSMRRKHVVDSSGHGAVRYLRPGSITSGSGSLTRWPMQVDRSTRPVTQTQIVGRIDDENERVGIDPNRATMKTTKG